MREFKSSNFRFFRNNQNIIHKIKYLLVTEGDKTEMIYFKGIIEYKNTLNINPLVELTLTENEEDEFGQSHPIKKIENFEKSVKEGKLSYIEGVDKVVFIFDRDPQNFKKKQLNEVIEKCKAKNFRLCLSNPTFEFFLLLHDDRVLSLDRKEMLENKRSNGLGKGKRYLELKLSEFFGHNKSKIEFETFLPSVRKAIENEKKFEEDLQKLEYSLGSNVGLFLNDILN